MSKLPVGDGRPRLPPNIQLPPSADQEFTPDQVAAIRQFVGRVNARAEQRILSTGIVSGAHWNAIQEELRSMESQTAAKDA